MFACLFIFLFAGTYGGNSLPNQKLNRPKPNLVCEYIYFGFLARKDCSARLSNVSYKETSVKNTRIRLALLFFISFSCRRSKVPVIRCKRVCLNFATSFWLTKYQKKKRALYAFPPLFPRIKGGKEK